MHDRFPTQFVIVIAAIAVFKIKQIKAKIGTWRSSDQSNRTGRHKLGDVNSRLPVIARTGYK